MRKSLCGVTVGLRALVGGACPYDRLLTSTGGLAISGGGGGGGGPDALFFFVQPNDATGGNIITPAVQIEGLGSPRRPATGFPHSLSLTFPLNNVRAQVSCALSA